MEVSGSKMVTSAAIDVLNDGLNLGYLKSVAKGQDIELLNLNVVVQPAKHIEWISTHQKVGLNGRNQETWVCDRENN